MKSCCACFCSIEIFLFTSSGARQSDIILASNTILLQFTIFNAYALDAFANAAEALAGKGYGANNRENFRSTVIASSRWALLFIFFSPFYSMLLGLR